MRFVYTREVLVACWILALCAVAFTAQITSVSGWFVLVSLALIPVVVLLRLWGDPPQTMSESIQKARR